MIENLKKKKQVKKTKISNKGITLIALVITIIVLLILAGVSIATLTGENGILTQAEKAKKETTNAEARERVELELAASFEKNGKFSMEKAKENLEKNLGLTTEDGSIKDNEDGTVRINFKGYEYDIDKNGNAKDYISIAKFLKVGDYVDYEPTKSDVNKTEAVEAGKLTYTSPTGGYSSEKGIITHGNGYGEQTFTTKANDESENGLKWRVLSISDDKVELIADTPVKADNGNEFSIKGGIGYLYAEQELNEVCKIYGYGYGADTNVGATFEIGGPRDTISSYTSDIILSRDFEPEMSPLIGKIESTGARSVTINDLNKLAGIYKDEKDGKMKYKDGTVIYEDYGKIIYQYPPINFPTLTSSNTSNPGQRGTGSGFKYTYYDWNKTNISDINIQNMIFKEEYWLATRGNKTWETGSNFYVLKAAPYKGVVGDRRRTMYCIFK